MKSITDTEFVGSTVYSPKDKSDSCTITIYDKNNHRDVLAGHIVQCVLSGAVLSTRHHEIRYIILMNESLMDSMGLVKLCQKLHGCQFSERRNAVEWVQNYMKKVPYDEYIDKKKEWNGDPDSEWHVKNLGLSSRQGVSIKDWTGNFIAYVYYQEDENRFNKIVKTIKYSLDMKKMLHIAYDALFKYSTYDATAEDILQLLDKIEESKDES